MSTPTSPGDRIAKILARAGIASRRDAERMVAEGRITVNGVVIDSPALNVTKSDTVLVDGKPLPTPEPARLWLYHKPPGLVTTERDELGRATIFDNLPEDMPRVMSIGRLDLNSEGLLLLTNDGALKRRLELPSTGWLRRYRVRINGRPTDADFEPLRQGLTIGDETFLPMIVSLDRQQGANAWLTVGLREGKNREIRRSMEDLGFSVNRLIRLSYGPFQLGQLQPGEVEEVRRKVLRDQLGEAAVVVVKPSKKEGFGPRRADLGPKAPVTEEAEAPVRKRFDKNAPRPAREEGAKSFRKGPPRDGDRPARSGDDKPRYPRRDDDGAKPFRKGPPRDGDRPARSGDDKPRYPRRDDDGAKPFRKGTPRDGAKPARSGDDKPRYPRRDDDGAKPFRKGPPRDGAKPARSGDDKPRYPRRDDDGAKSFRKGPPRDGDRPARSGDDKPRYPRRDDDGAKPFRKGPPRDGARPARSGGSGKPAPKPGAKPGGGKPRGPSAPRAPGGKGRPSSR